MGAWRYVKPRMDTAMRELMESQAGSAQPLRIRYVGRPAAASPGLFHFCNALPQPDTQLWLWPRMTICQLVFAVRATCHTLLASL